MNISTRARRWLAAAGAGIALTVTTAAIAPTAQAATINNCTQGNACIYEKNSYGGGWDPYGVSRTGFGNIGNSVVSNGKTCRVIFYKNANYGGHWFYMLRALDLSNYKDPNLSNGAGTGRYSSENFSKQLTSLRFTDCIS